MHTGDLVKASDGKEAIVVGAWAREKLFLIERYCTIFNQSMKAKWSTRTYVDLFAGPGKCVIEDTKEEVNGSPLRALNIAVPFTQYFFNDINADFVSALKTRLDNNPAKICFFNADCNQAVNLLLQDLPRNSRDFCFIDPFNWEIKFDSIRKLTHGRRMDLAITFHIGNIKRVADRPTAELIDFFPDSNWQQEYRGAGEEGKLSGRVLLDAYERGLKEIGHVEIKDYVLMRNRRQVPLYYLIFASKHKRGAEFWDKIAVRSEAGQIRLQIYERCKSENRYQPEVTSTGYELLNGSSSVAIQQVNDGAIIKRFDRTPPPTKLTDVICPHFLELKWSYGCPFDCAWCYLKGTFRFHPTKTKPVFKDREKIRIHLTRFINEVQTPEILNSGEIADSLMGEGLREPFSKFIIPIFESQNIHRVLFVTKSDNIKHLLEISPHNQVIISFSLNANEVASKWEKLAPSVDRRLEAGKRLNKAGYEVRIRIDPMVPVPNWKQYYTNLVRQVFASFMPSRITLGSLRGLQTTINGSSDKSWLEYLKENSNWGKKIEFGTRFEMYSTIINLLRNSYGYSNVALCKETLEMWRKLGMDFKKIKCNCVW